MMINVVLLLMTGLMLASLIVQIFKCHFDVIPPL
jgi:hypothetical protein